MPIKIPDNLPAAKILKEENIFIMSETRATTQRIRPLKIINFKYYANQNCNGNTVVKNAI